MHGVKINKIRLPTFCLIILQPEIHAAQTRLYRFFDRWSGYKIIKQKGVRFLVFQHHVYVLSLSHHGGNLTMQGPHSAYSVTRNF